MPNQIRILEEIQRIDLEIASVEEEEKRYREGISALSAAIKEAEEGLGGIDSEVEGLKSLLKGVEERIRENTERIKKDEKRLGEIKNDRELKAINKEIAAAGKAVKQAEKELDELNSKLTDKKVTREAKSLEAGKKRTELERLSGELDAKEASWREAVGEKAGKKEVFKAQLGPDVIRRYETIRSKRGGRAVVPVRNEVCQGCYMGIPPQVFLQIKRGDEGLMACPHCHRILYVEETVQPEAI